MIRVSVREKACLCGGQVFFGGSSAGFGCATAATGCGGGFGGDLVISPRASHFKHFAVRPTYSSGASCVCEQFGQTKTAMMSQCNGERKWLSCLPPAESRLRTDNNILSRASPVNCSRWLCPHSPACHIDTKFFENIPLCMFGCLVKFKGHVLPRLSAKDSVVPIHTFCLTDCNMLDWSEGWSAVRWRHVA